MIRQPHLPSLTFPAVRLGSTWLRPVPEHPGIWASSHGCLWTSRRVKGGGFRKLKPGLQGGRSWDKRGGYLRHTLLDPSSSGKRRTVPVYVHLAVISAWHGPPPEDGVVYHCDHKDDDHLNNRPDNLQWLPAADNVAKRNRRGGMSREEDWEGVL